MSSTIKTLQALVVRSPRTRREIAEAAGIDAGALSRLMSGERGLPVARLEKLAEVLGHEIKVVRVRRKRGQ